MYVYNHDHLSFVSKSINQRCNNNITLCGNMKHIVSNKKYVIIFMFYKNKLLLIIFKKNIFLLQLKIKKRYVKCVYYNKIYIYF